MMRKKHCFYIIFAIQILVCYPLFSQYKKLDLYTITTNAEIFPKRIPVIDWIPGTNELAYSKDLQILLKTTYPSKKTDTITSVSKLNKLLLSKTDKSAQMQELDRLPRFIWKDKNTALFEHAKAYFLYSISDNKITKVNSYPKEAESLDFCLANYITAYTKGNNLFISVEGKEIAVTDEKEPEIRMCNYIHREEFGITKGTFWSPAGNYLAFYRMDERDVTDYPLVDVTKRIAELKLEKYPMAGMSSHYVTLGIYNISKKTTVYMKTGEPKEQYLTSVTWSPDEKYLFIGLLNREQNHLKLNMYDAASGNLVKTLFEEKSDKYVEPLDPLYFIPGSNNKFLWFSQRDGYRHLYKYNTDGKLISQLTKGQWVIKDIISFDDKGSKVYVYSTKTSPIEQHIYAIDIKSGKMEKITNTPGWHYGSISSTGLFLLDIFSNIDIASKYNVINTTGKVIETLLEDKNPLRDYNMPSTEIFKLRNEENTDLYCRLIKPADFDSTKKYPVIVYVYGGPHAQLVTNSWLGGADLFLNYLSQEGFLIFTLDNRGSANRGFEFESALHLNMGSIEVDDQLFGIKYLKTLNYVDTSRIGVHGWSYGGYMTIMMLLKAPDLFRAGVAGGPVTDWKYYEIMYGERYMSTPENNPLGYEQSSLLNKIQNLKGRLLIIHGALDPVVVWQHSLVLVEEAIKANILIDYFVYPTDKHGIKWRYRENLYRKIEQYFKDFL